MNELLIQRHRADHLSLLFLTHVGTLYIGLFAKELTIQPQILSRKHWKSIVKLSQAGTDRPKA